MERASAQRQRQLALQQKNLARMQDRERAAYEVEVFENTVDVLTSVHKESAELVDWEALAAADPPGPPVRSTESSANARRDLDEYQPRGLDKIGGRSEKKRQALELAVADAQRREEETYTSALSEHETHLKDHNEVQEIARGVLDGSAESYLEAVRKFSRFKDMRALGSKVSVSVTSPKTLEATIHIMGESVVPTEAKSLLQSGKLSTKNMPKGRFYEIYQDYVCGAVLRVANELCALLPVEMVITTAVDELLDKKTGHLQEQAVLSVAIPRPTLERMNLENVDPSDALSNFVHRMKFKKTAGFEPVEKLTAADLES